jgi:hypothetical protein
METRLKTYRSEAKFATDRAAMEVGGWRVKKCQRHSEEWSLAPAPAPGPGALDDLLLKMHPNLLSPGWGRDSAQGLARLVVLPFWPFAWLWTKWRSGPRIDVIYERS